VRRILFTTVAVISLLIFIGSAVLWVRSYFVNDGVRRIHSYAKVLPASSTTEKVNGYFVDTQQEERRVSSRRESFFDSTSGVLFIRDNWRVEVERTGASSGVYPGKEAFKEAERASHVGFDSGAIYTRYRSDPYSVSVMIYDVQRGWYVPTQTAFVHHFLGLAVAVYDTGNFFDGDRIRNVEVAVPWPAIILVTALPPAIWLYAFRRRRRTMKILQNLCLKCGYSLVGNTSGVCPECGTPVPAVMGEKPRPECPG
jgi:hypothetical protein